ncbi:hypothetical protein [Flavobacterium branchiophilum]|nr:hypothetical protein [Flavobacterium branchiophilum]
MSVIESFLFPTQKINPAHLNQKIKGKTIVITVRNVIVMKF